MGIEQKVAIVTGASQGIGAALVQGFRDRNYRVVATARSIKPSGDDDVLAVPGDIADRKTAERVVAQAVTSCGAKSCFSISPIPSDPAGVSCNPAQPERQDIHRQVAVTLGRANDGTWGSN